MVSRSNTGWAKRLAAQFEDGIPKALKKAMVENIEGEAKRIVYLGDEGDDNHLHRRTGTLQRSITTEIEDDGKSIRASTGTNLVYAPVHEFGADIWQRKTQIAACGRVHDVPGRLIHIKARPFIVPAWEANKDYVREDLVEACDKMLKTELNRK